MNRAVAAGTAAAVAFCSILLVVVLFGLDDEHHNCVPGDSTSAGNLPPGSRVMPMATGTYTLSSGFGPRGGTMHRGQDFAATAGQTIYAAADGIVTAVGPASGFGDWIVLDHNINGHPFSTVYGHMFAADIDPAVTAGATVHAGQRIATVGYNGEVSPPGPSGAHLHFEVWDGTRLGGGTAIDPMPWLQGAGQPGGSSTPPGPDTTHNPDSDLVSGAGTTGTPSNSTSPTSEADTTPDSTQAGCEPEGGRDDLGPQTVPPEYEPWIRRAGSLCPQIHSSLLAAQLKQESGFRADARSSSGAMGPAQFMPGTWQTWGRDDDGNGQTSPNDIGDAVMAQGRYMCSIAARIDQGIAEGSIAAPNGPEELYLAAYNAGLGAVLSSHGFPTGHPDYEVQTRPYASHILTMAQHYSKTLS